MSLPERAPRDSFRRHAGWMALAAAVLVAGATPAQAQQPRRDLILECMACHGEDGIAKDKDVPHLAGQNYEYLLKQLHDFQKGRRPHKEMRVMSRLLTDTELEEIADFYARLPRDPGRRSGWLGAPLRLSMRASPAVR